MPLQYRLCIIEHLWYIPYIMKGNVNPSQFKVNFPVQIGMKSRFGLQQVKDLFQRVTLQRSLEKKDFVELTAYHEQRTKEEACISYRKERKFERPQSVLSFCMRLPSGYTRSHSPLTTKAAHSSRHPSKGRPISVSDYSSGTAILRLFLRLLLAPV